jgi:hypothetical protein
MQYRRKDGARFVERAYNVLRVINFPVSVDGNAPDKPLLARFLIEAANNQIRSH